MKQYYIYDLYALLCYLINQGYLVEAVYDKDNVKQYVVKKCHE